MAIVQAEINSSGVTASDKLTNEVSNITKLFGSDNGASMTKAQVEQVFTSLSNAKNELNALVKMNVSESSIKILSTQANTLLEQINNFEKNNPQFSNFSKTIDGVDVSVDKLKNDLQTVNSAADLRLIKSQFANLQTSFKSTSVTANGLATDISRLSKAESWQKWLDNNTKSTKKYGKQIDEIITKMKNLDVQMTKTESNDLTAKMKNIQIDARNSGLLGMTSVDKVKAAWQKFGGWSIATGSLMQGVNKVKEAVSEMKDIDDIITEINKTSDLTTKELKTLATTSYDKASKYGKKATDYLSGVEEMSRSGFYGDKGEALAQQSLLAQAAGDMTADLANKYVLATNAAYKYEGNAEKINAVLDGQNSITNRNSVAMEDMAEAMTEAGTVASSYRVSIKDLSAMIGTIESVTKLGGSEVGNGIKSILINLQNVSSSKITGTLDKANASMTEMVNGTKQLRNPIAILKDLAKTFNELDESDPMRAEILTNIGGKYQATKLAALLQNQELFDKMLKDYSEGSGSAMEEAEKSANNLTGSLNKLDNTWTEFVNHLIQSDDIKNIVNLGNDALSLIDGITSHIGLLGIAITGSGIFGVTKFIKNFDWVFKPYTKLSNSFLVGQS